MHMNPVDNFNPAAEEALLASTCVEEFGVAYARAYAHAAADGRDDSSGSWVIVDTQPGADR
jgi:hypothetical protein